MARRKVETVPLMVRLPPELHQELVESAAEDVRSLNGQLTVLLREALERRRKRAESDSEQS